MTSKERIMAALEHREADRAPFWEEIWGTTTQNWEKERPSVKDTGFNFDLDSRSVVGIDWTCMLEGRVIEETDEYTISLDADGVRVKNLKGTPVSHREAYPLTDRASWEELKPLHQWSTKRVDLEAARKRNSEDAEEFRIYAPCCCGFERFKYNMGIEGILIALAEDPDWVREMCETTAQVCIDGLEYLLGEGLEFDAAFITEDQGYSNGPFFSPRTYREVIRPCQERFIDVCHARGLKVMLHSCGDNRQLMDQYVEMGFDLLNPLEVKAGMDLIQLKKDYGEKLTFWGGIDIRTLTDPDPTALEREIATKVPVAKQGGGYIFGSDHSIPDNVPLERFEKMLELGRRYGAYN